VYIKKHVIVPKKHDQKNTKNTAILCQAFGNVTFEIISEE